MPTWLLMIWLVAPPANDPPPDALPAHELQVDPPVVEAPAIVDRRTLFGDVELPVYSPAWSMGEPLRQIATRIESGDRPGAQRLVERMLEEWRGSFLITRQLRTGGSDDRSSLHPERSRGIVAQQSPYDPWLRIPPPWELLRQWHQTLPAATRDQLIARSPTGRDQRLGNLDPLLWYAPQAADASRRAALALESGDIPTAWRIDRSRPTPTLERWLAAHRSDRPLGRPLARSTYPDRSDGALDVAPPDDLYLLTRYPLELTRNRDRAEPLNRGTPEHPERRTPLAAIFPLVQEDRVILATGSEAFAVSTSRPPKIAWSVDAQTFARNARPQPSLLLLPVSSVATERYWAFLFRTGRDELKSHPSKQFFDRRRGLKLEGFNRLVIFDPPTTPDARPTPRLDVSTLLGHGETVCGKPVIIEDRVIFPVFRGLREVAIDLVAVDIAERRIAWRQSLANRRTNWISSQDLRGLIPSVELIDYAGDILVASSFGFVTRVDRTSGDLLGLQFFPQFDPLEFRLRGGTELARFFGMPFPRLPAPRLRFPGPGVILERPNQGPLWITLPPRSMNLLAIDLNRWQVEWRLPVERQTMLLGVDGDRLLLLDAGIDSDERTMTLRGVDTTGRHRRFVDLELSVNEARLVGGVRDSEGPLLSGMPRLIGHHIWVPTITGLECFEVRPEATEVSRRPADRVIAWPTGARGGTPYPLPDGKIVTVSRGDIGFNTRGFLEIFDGRP